MARYRTKAKPVEVVEAWPTYYIAGEDATITNWNVETGPGRTELLKPDEFDSKYEPCRRIYADSVRELEE